jgi:hypothetical protein
MLIIISRSVSGLPAIYFNNESYLLWQALRLDCLQYILIMKVVYCVNQTSKIPDQYCTILSPSPYFNCIQEQRKVNF